MQPNLLYVNLITLTLLSLLGFGMAYPDNNQVSINRRLKYNFGEKAQALINPSRNIKAPARQLSDWLIKPIEKDLKVSGAS